jgi:hypothetical protein
MDQLMRACDRQTVNRPAACCLFWTLGGQQVGKAALAGWREILLSAVKREAKLWPFDGGLAELAVASQLILAETYPAEAYRHIGVTFGKGMSKRRREDRLKNSKPLFDWAERSNVTLEPGLSAAIADGFGSSEQGEDKFDALAGLAGMIEVLDGRGAEGAPSCQEVFVEGWIFGQAA